MGGQACVLYGGTEFSRDTERLERDADRRYGAPLFKEREQIRQRK
jgi:hypothetical protein